MENNGDVILLLMGLLLASPLIANIIKLISSTPEDKNDDSEI